MYAPDLTVTDRRQVAFARALGVDAAQLRDRRSRGLQPSRETTMLQESMKDEIPLHRNLSDAELLNEVRGLASDERKATAQVVAALGELDARRLYRSEGYPSLFVYCTQALQLSEHAAYARIEAARASRKWPSVLGQCAFVGAHGRCTERGFLEYPVRGRRRDERGEPSAALSCAQRV
jgi:hypothetical protein